MPDNEKNNGQQKDREIESILEERKRIVDEEKMQETAQKYRAKPKIIDIYSNADRKPRLVNMSPFDYEKKADEPPESDVSENTIIGAKTATTMKGELIMEGSKSGERLMTPEEAQQAAERGKEEESEKSEKPERVHSRCFGQWQERAG